MKSAIFSIVLSGLLFTNLTLGDEVPTVTYDPNKNLTSLLEELYENSQGVKISLASSDFKIFLNDTQIPRDSVNAIDVSKVRAINITTKGGKEIHIEAD